MKILFGVLILIIGIIGANVLANEAGWTVLNVGWWLTTAPLCLFTGMAAGMVAGR